jgi:hypothetical protein
VWDTVSTLGAGWRGLIAIGAGYLLISLLAGSITLFGFKYFFGVGNTVDSYLCHFLFFLIGVPFITYLISSFSYKQPLNLKKYRMAFYNTNLDPNVTYARHAISIDENRKDFGRVPWREEAPPMTSQEDKPDAPIRFKQIWFAGNHSDVGGSYTENESRLSDISLAWIVEEAEKLPHPIIVDKSVLNLHPSSSGFQHDEREALIDRWPTWLVNLALEFIPRARFGWVEGFRKIPLDAPLHISVIERFKLETVAIYGTSLPYRPENLRNHNDVKGLYT